METIYTLYEWKNNKLLKETVIPNPYSDTEELVLPCYSAEADHATLRQTIRTKYTMKSRIVESLYK